MIDRPLASWASGSSGGEGWRGWSSGAGYSAKAMAVKPAMRVLGFMTGTSLDAIDMAVLETDGEEITGLGPAGEKKLDPAARVLVERAIADALRLKAGDPTPATFAPAAAATAVAMAPTSVQSTVSIPIPTARQRYVPPVRINILVDPMGETEDAGGGILAWALAGLLGSRRRRRPPAASTVMGTGLGSAS